MSKNTKTINRAFMYKNIPYRFCYEEGGMMETENGVYNSGYKIIPPEEAVKGSYHAKMIRMRMENILQKLAENFTFEFTIRTCHMDKEKYLDEVMIPEQGGEDAYHHLRELYNRVLQENLDIGHNNFIEKSTWWRAAMFHKKIKKESYDKEHQKPIVKSSICSGEKVAGFKDLQTGKFEEVMLIRDSKDLDFFFGKV